MIDTQPLDNPRALDILADFRKKFGSIIERRIAELNAELETRNYEPDSAALWSVFDERDSLRHFEQELTRVIGAFVNEAVRRR